MQSWRKPPVSWSSPRPSIGTTLAAGPHSRNIGNNAVNCPVTLEAASNNIVFSASKTHVALLGVSDLVVVQTADAILVCHRHDVEKIKNLVQAIPKQLQ